MLLENGKSEEAEGSFFYFCTIKKPTIDEKSGAEVSETNGQGAEGSERLNLSLFYAFKTELHGDPRIGRKRTSTSS